MTDLVIFSFQNGPIWSKKIKTNKRFLRNASYFIDGCILWKIHMLCVKYVFQRWTKRDSGRPVPSRVWHVGPGIDRPCRLIGAVRRSCFPTITPYPTGSRIPAGYSTTHWAGQEPAGPVFNTRRAGVEPVSLLHLKSRSQNGGAVWVAYAVQQGVNISKVICTHVPPLRVCQGV